MRALLDAIVPPLCLACRRRDARGGWLCAACARGLERAPRPPSLQLDAIDRAKAAHAYEGVARELVAALKFRRLLGAAEVAAAALAGLLPPGAEATVVPVPASPWRLRARGFDPAAAIAGALVARAPLPLCQPLARVDRGRQRGRGREQRRRSPPKLELLAAPPRAVLLIDDVTTTGTTLVACAERLREGGSEEVDALAFAAAPRERRAVVPPSPQA